MRYITKARKLREVGFDIYGYGRFGITESELGQILKYLEKNDFKSIAIMYNILSRQRL